MFSTNFMLLFIDKVTIERNVTPVVNVVVLVGVGTLVPGLPGTSEALDVSDIT